MFLCLQTGYDAALFLHSQHVRTKMNDLSVCSPSDTCLHYDS